MAEVPQCSGPRAGLAGGLSCIPQDFTVIKPLDDARFDDTGCKSNVVGHCIPAATIVIILVHGLRDDKMHFIDLSALGQCRSGLRKSIIGEPIQVKTPTKEHNRLEVQT